MALSLIFKGCRVHSSDRYFWQVDQLHPVQVLFERRTLCFELAPWPLHVVDTFGQSQGEDALR